jgi:outer membrane protein insertion porin family
MQNDKRKIVAGASRCCWRLGGVFVFSILTLISFYLSSSVTFASESPETIKAIEVEGLSRISKKELTGLICFKVGDVIDRELLKNGIRRAFTKGIFLDVQAEAFPYEGGIKLRYSVKEIPLIEKITVQGNENISDSNIKKIIMYKEGEDFREEYLDRTRMALLDFYERKGFPAATIKINVENTKKTSAVNIHINIHEGPPLIIKKIDAPDDIKAALRISEGRIFDRDIVDQELKRLENYLERQDYIHPVVGPYEFVDGDLIIPVIKGQRLDLYFKGNLSVSTKKLKNEMPFFEDQAVSDESVQEAIDRIRDLYKSEGYYHAQIAAGVQSEKDLIKITFIVHEGKKVILKKIDFQGSSLAPDVIKKIMPLEEEKPYNENILDASREAILRFYNALGYLKTDITGIEKKFQKDGTELELIFNIKEGPQTKIKTIKIDGNKNIGTREIMKVLRLREGKLYNTIDIGDARYRILSLYNAHGYLDAIVDVESEIDEDKAFITFRIKENKPSVVGKIIYRGNLKTKLKIIQRELTLNEGDPINYDELLKTKQRLYKLGIFNSVSIDTLEPIKIGEDRLQRDVLVTLKEGNAGTFEISLGYGDYEKFRGALDINYRNIGGYNRQAGFRTEVSSVDQRFVFSFKEPRLFNDPNLPLSVLLTKENKRSVNLDTNEVFYKIDRTSLLLSVEREIKKNWKANLSYEYSFVDTKDVQPGVILSKEDTGTLAIGSVSTALFYDNRDDPFDPSSGSLQGIVLKFASRVFLSESEFIKGTVQSSWYFRLARKVVFAFSLRGGAAYSLDHIKELPLIERFFLGGRSTVRGYNNDTLGPKGTDGNPTGGNIFALANGEFRFSVKKGFGFVTFLDTGNVWKLAENMDAKLKYTAGVGLRYKTPVGPVRLDYGYKLNKEKGESSGEVHFSFGQAF